MSFNFVKAFNPHLNKPCPTNCQAKIKSLLWITNQPFWSYQCKCCGAWQFKLGKRGEVYG